MFGIEIINLKRENGQRFYYDKIKIKRLVKEIIEFLKEESFMDDFNFSRKMILSLEIKTNNSIEGIKDEMSSIEEAIQNRKISSTNKRIINLYYGYRYILQNGIIDKKHLKKLYNILSKDQLDDYSIENMGEYYRKEEVYVLNARLDSMIPSFDKGMNPNNVNQAMDDLFEYIKQEDEENLLDIFIKSQIIHFYFVYVHPYYDVNGRTARTFSLWYLLKKKAYPFVIFNRGISLSKEKYKDSIKKSRRGNITPFLEYSLKTLKKELEKEKIIYNIRNNFGESLSKSEYEILEYILTTKTHTIKDIIRLYSNNNQTTDKGIIFMEKIYPLIEKEILIWNEKDNTLKINKKFITMDKKKVKELKIKPYLAE